MCAAVSPIVKSRLPESRRQTLSRENDFKEGAAVLNTQLIGEKVRRARFARGKLWTQKKLAEAAGLSQGYISAIERGEEFPSLKALTKISEVLDWPLSFFIDSVADFAELPEAPVPTEEEAQPLPSALRDTQLRQALQTVVKAGLDTTVQPIQLLEQTVAELVRRVHELEMRLASLEQVPAETTIIESPSSYPPNIN